MSPNHLAILGAICAMSVGLGACNGIEAPPLLVGESNLPDTSTVDPQNPPANETPPAATPPTTVTGRSYSQDVLLFNGTGVSTTDWQSTEQILKANGFSYQLVNSAQMNAMTPAQLADFGAIVVPGGSGGTITNNLTTATRLRIRQAVRNSGVGYVGFCAGAWVAVGPEADTSQTASYGIAVAKGSVLPYYYPGGDTSLIADMVDVTFADGSHRQLVWWGGPSTPEWARGVVARYENGKPAISQTVSGKGYVVISGPHPEAPPSWRNTAGTDSDGMDYDIALDMIDAAIHATPMNTY